MKTNLIDSIKKAAKKVSPINPEEKAQIALILAVVEMCDLKTLILYSSYINSLIH